MFKSESVAHSTGQLCPVSLHVQVEDNSPEAMYEAYLHQQAINDERLMTPCVRRLIFN